MLLTSLSLSFRICEMEIRTNTDNMESTVIGVLCTVNTGHPALVPARLIGCATGTGGAEQVHSRFCVFFQTKRRRRRRRKVGMWMSVQDVSSVISSHPHFCASGQLGLREYQYLLREECSACVQRMFLVWFGLALEVERGKVGLTELYFTGWSSQWETNLLTTSA